MCDLTCDKKLTRSEQSRINGARSRGPVTPEGKARSSRNSLKHGLYAHHAVLLDNEDRDAFNELLAAYQRRFNPADPLEHNLVRDLCALDWNLVRARAVQANLLNLEMARQALDPDSPHPRPVEDHRLASAWQTLCDSSRALSLSCRQVESCIRTRAVTLKTLYTLRANFPVPERTRDLACFQVLEIEDEPETNPVEPEEAA